jgi:hypothetical protein
LGNYTEFYAENRPSLGPRGIFLTEGAPYLSAKYCLPVVWLALFDADDVQVFTDLRDHDDLHVHLASPREAALARLARRRLWLLAHYPRLRPVWLDQFEGYVAAMTQSHVHLSTMEVASMVYGAEEWAMELPLILRMFEESPLAPQPSLGPLPTPMPPPAAGSGLLYGLAAWWRAAPRAPAPPARTMATSGWDRFSKHFREEGLDRADVEVWQFLGAGEDEPPPPWYAGE